MIDTFTLTCKCGVSATLTNATAETDGWMLDGKNRSLCPSCSAKREKRSTAALRKKYGDAAANRAIADVDRLLGRR